MNYLFRITQTFAFAALLLGSCPISWAHAGPESHLRHWEVASADPDRLVVTFAGDPARSFSVNWRTGSGVPTGFGEIAPAGDHPRFDLDRKRVEAVTEAVNLNAAYRNSQGTVHTHSVTFRELEPDTLYAYRVGDGSEHWSEWIHFRTASAESDSFTFLYFGDAQNEVLSHWSRVIRSAYSTAPNARLAIHAGDLINRAHADREWAEWFKAGGWIHASLGNIVVPGNHEYDRLTRDDSEKKRLSLQWRPQFTLPVEETLPDNLHETVYYVDYQGVRFVVLNSIESVEEQAAWLDRVLEKNGNRWTVLTFHHPVFSSGRGRDRQEWRDLLKPVIDRHSVDLVLQGHDHTYARGHVPVRMTDGNESLKDGHVTSVYVNSVSGSKMYQFQEDGWNTYSPYGVQLERMAENTQFFQVVAIDGNQLSYKAYTATGKLYDCFIITKDGDGTKRLTSPIRTSRRFENTLPYSREGF